MKIFLLMILFLSSNLPAQDADQQLKSLQNKFETINDLTVDVVQKSGGKESPNGGFSGKLSYKKENQFHLDLKNSLITSDGSTIWNYNKKENKIIINNVDESDPSFFSFSRIIYDYPTECYISLEKEGSVDLLVFVPKENSDLSFSKAMLWISKDNLINKIILEGIAAENVEVRFSNYKLNQKLADSKFKFTPPEGSTIIDLR